MPAVDATTTFRAFDVSSGRLLVQFDSGVTATAADKLMAGLAHVTGEVGEGGLLRVAIDSPLGLAKLIDQIGRLPGVRFVEPDYKLSALEDPSDGSDSGTGGGTDPGTDPGTTTGPDNGGITPQDVSNDPAVTSGQTWGMYGDTTLKANVYGSQAGELWTAGYTGSTQVAVGLVDTGVDYTSPDLYLNIWLNQGEIPAALKAQLKDVDGDGRITFRDLNDQANAASVSDVNGNGRIDAGDLLHDARWADGIDQDGNGYVDDLIGWDFVNNDNDPMDDVGHGTHVAGVMSALGGNGTGVAGVGWSTQLVVAKFLGPNGGYTSDAIRALDYVTNVSQAPGAPHVVATNDSWGGGGPSQALLDAMTRGAQAGILFVAAAGNGGSDSIGDNNDVVANYPSNYSTAAGAGYDAVIAVASLTSTGGLSSFSNYGIHTVDLAAPGSSIYSTLPGGYGTLSGTSMAAPFVTGAIAVYAAANPGASAAQIRADLLASTIATASLAGKTVTGGRLDASAFVYRASQAGVTIVGTAGDDTFSLKAAPAGQSTASVFDDTITGGAGNDKLDGGVGADRLVGGAGNDTFTVDNPGDVVVELPGEGTADLINASISYALPDEVEKLTLTGSAAINGTGNALANTITGNGAANVLDGGQGADVLTGNAGDDTLIGGEGNDRLTGSAGADRMVGGPGDDTYYIDAANDVVVEAPGEGTDLVSSPITYVLPANVEKLTLSGTAAVDGTGNELANTLTGNGAANVLDGGLGDDSLTGGAGDDTLIGGEGNDRLTGSAGADRMDGGAGDDLYSVDDPGDVIVEAADGGIDSVSSTVSYVLPDNVEKITLSGTAAIDAGGNALANSITGNSGANVLSGGAGADTIVANAGADTLDGGAGADRLTGGTGADRFVFQAGEAAGDTITDFAAGDVIELHGYGAGSTLAKVAGSSTSWIVTDGVTHQTEIIVLSNKYALAAADYIFT